MLSKKVKSRLWVISAAAVLGFLIIAKQPRVLQAAWQKPAQPPSARPLTALIAHPFEKGRLIAASGRQVFSAPPAGAWQNFSDGPPFPAEKLLYLKEAPRDFFILTQKSISRCTPAAGNCTEICRVSQARGNNILSFAIDPEDPGHWFLGTDRGLFESDDAGKTWFGFGNLKRPVSLLRFWKNRFFLAAGRTLYQSEDGSHFDSIFSLQEANAETAEEAEGFSEEEITGIDAPPYYELLLPVHSEHPFWLASREGIFESTDKGENWRRLPESGLRSSETRFLAWSKKTGKLFAGTAKGVYAYLPERNKWQELYQGLENSDIRGLAVLEGTDETLAVLSPAGFFSTIILPDQIRAAGEIPLNQDQKILFQELLRLEPSPQDIQNAAVRYANVKNGKIKRWHSGSRMAALLPSLSFGKDFSRGNSIDIDRRGTNEPDFYIAGPDDVSRGWDFDVGWDLGDFVFSSAQTSIDSREKLMVELRNDILTEVTRVYYERRRLELEILFQPAESEQAHLEKLLRLDELTSLLDGMTNGYFGKKMESVYQQRPELREIWVYKSPDTSHQVTSLEEKLSGADTGT